MGVSEPCRAFFLLGGGLHVQQRKVSFEEKKSRIRLEIQELQKPTPND